MSEWFKEHAWKAWSFRKGDIAWMSPAFIETTRAPHISIGASLRNRIVAAAVYVNYKLFSFRRAAHYFFIRRLTAFRAAGDIFRRRVPLPSTPPFEPVVAAPRSPGIVGPPVRTSRRLGNIFTKSASSDCSSFQRTTAPRLARSRIEKEGFVIVN